MKRYLIAFLAVLVAAGVWAGQAGADNLDIDEMAAVLVLPVITGGDGPNPLKPGVRGEVVIASGSGLGGGNTAATLATVTNGKTDAVILVVDVISGDVVAPGEPSDACQTNSFICPLTGRETTTFVFTPADNGKSRLDVECSTAIKDPQGRIIAVTTDPDPKAAIMKAQNGIMVVSVADPLGNDCSNGDASLVCEVNNIDGLHVVSEDIIFGDAVVVDTAAGQAYSFGAIPFQAGNRGNNGDKVYEFDDKEYVKFPSALATNFLAPGVDVGGNDVQAELILFTLDFATGNIPLPRVAIGGYTYNDDEEYCDWDHEFDCFEIAALGDIDDCNNYYAPPSLLGLGSISGHLEMYPQAIATANDSHDISWGNGDNVRNRGFHGWLVQNSTGVVLAGDVPIPGAPAVSVPNAAAWGRPLAQSTTDLEPSTDDESPTLDADPTGPGQ